MINRYTRITGGHERHLANGLEAPSLSFFEHTFEQLNDRNDRVGHWKFLYMRQLKTVIER